MDKVFKKVHEDGSETVIKQVKSAFRDGDGNYKERDEVVTSIFISSSAGCPYKCAFCHLTEMGMRFKKLHYAQVVENVQEAIKECTFVDQKTKFKICFMGVGDPTVNSFNTVMIVQELYGNLRIQEVDISSISYTESDVEYFNNLMVDFPLIVRLFYSIHTGIDETRQNIIGGVSKRVTDDLSHLNLFRGKVKLHYTPVKGLNDSLLDAVSIMRRVCYWDKSWQVRMLEFNPYSDSVYERPAQDQLKKLYKLFQKNGVDVKWQVSKGKEELASCGMFQDQTN